MKFELLVYSFTHHHVHLKNESAGLSQHKKDTDSYFFTTVLNTDRANYKPKKYTYNFYMTHLLEDIHNEGFCSGLIWSHLLVGGEHRVL